MAQTRPVRGTRVAARLAVPDRHQPVPERAALDEQPNRRPAAGAHLCRPAARTHAPGRTALAGALPDVLLDGLADQAPGPESRYETKESISLAFVAALQHLPPRQRATVVLRDVLGLSGAEVADILECSQEAVAGALERARATLANRLPSEGRDRAPLPDSPPERAILARFVTAFEGGDVESVAALLTDDARLTMPPLPVEYHGRTAAAHFPSTIAFRDGTRQFRLVPTRANAQPAFGCYERDPHSPIAHGHGLMVLTMENEQISALTRFLDNSLLPHFGLPRTLRE
jgi:RNA polymerase sigma-70 factor (TIGR02960 family)